MDSTKKSIIFSVAVAVVAAAGLIAAISLSVRVAKLEANNAELEQKLQASFQQVEVAKADFAKRVADSEAAQSQEAKHLEAAVTALGKAPAPDDVAKAVLTEGGNDLVTTIAATLIKDPEHAKVLRGPSGKDADPAEVAKNITGSEAYPTLVKAVARDIWETRRRDLLSDPEFIATIAAKVHDEYGAELANAVDTEKQATAIAQELAKEPAFAALV